VFSNRLVHWLIIIFKHKNDWLPSNKIKHQFTCKKKGKGKWSILVVWNTENEFTYWSFSKLYTYSRMYTQNKSDITMYDEVLAKKTEQRWWFFVQNYILKGCLHLLPTICIMNTNPEQSCKNPFPQQYTLKGCLYFLLKVGIINSNPEQNSTNNFNSTVQNVKYNHSFITN